ncbi:MAG: hypothetical protein ACTHOC_04980 [Luteimonas sp.]
MKVSPVTRAVRSALAASAAMLALAGSGPALAGDCTAPADNTIRCNGDFNDTLNFAVDDLTLVVGDEAPSSIAPPAGNPGILADWAGNIGVSSAADITAYAADGIHASGSGDIDVSNDGAIDAYGAGQIIGIYAYSDGGDVTVTNGGTVSAYSYDGLADGIFASGDNVDVSNVGGAIDANGYGWAAGIEAQGAGTTNVSNDGAITAYAYAAGGYAFGIYATGEDVTVANGGTVDAQGYYANGVFVQSGGDAMVENAGTVTAGGLYTSLYATGVHAASGGLDGNVSVDNAGNVVVNGYAGATGIEALATGAGGTASVSNSGDVYANSYYKYASGSTGIVASADGDATVDNSGGITAIASGSAYGAMALSFNGEASVTNSGDIAVSNTAILYYAATGIVSSSQNGGAYAGNSGSIDVSSKYIGTGIDASGMTGTTVANDGDVSVDAWYAYGIRANSGAGDVSVENSGSIDAVYSGAYFAGKAWGILALSTAGDISVDNSGDVYTSVSSQSVGVFARAAQGSAAVANSGSITALSYDGTAAGVFARADYGDIAVANAEGGAITAYSAYGYAYGVLGSGVNASVVNDGAIAAYGFYAAAGINVYGDELVTVSGSGSIDAIAYGVARGINATSGSGDVSVANGGDVFAGSVLVDAIGVYAYSGTGDVAVSNDGDVTAIAPYGLADGIFAYGANADVANTGSITAVGNGWAAGIEAQAADAVSVTNAGDITVQTLGAGEGFGIYAGGGAGGAAVDNAGTIYVRGYEDATGIYAHASGGVQIGNSGGVYAGYLSVDDYGNTYSSSYALALFGVSGGDGAEVAIENSGVLQAISFAASSGAEARSLGTGGSASVSNSGDVVAAALSFGGSAAGLVATADGDATIDNSGSLFAYSGGMAYGAIALAFNGDASVTNSGDIQSINTAYPYYSAYGVVSASQNGGAGADNSGFIYAYSPYIGVGMEVAGMTGAALSNSGGVYANAWVSYGVRASSGGGDVSIDNSGEIAAYYSGTYLGYAFGMHASAGEGDIAIDNSGDVFAAGGLQSLGIFASTTTGDITIDSSGSAESEGLTGLSAAIFATSTGGDVTVDNSDQVLASSVYGTSVGAFARASAGTAAISSSGDVDSTSTYGTAYGILARGAYSGIDNSGDVTMTGYYAAYGAYADGALYAAIDNSGSIETHASGVSIGAAAIGLYGATVSNSGDISASADEGGLAIGVFAQSYYDVLVENSGTITASHPDQAVAVQMYSVAGTATLDNSGTIATDTSSAGSIAVVGSPGANAILNTGDIYGAIVTFDGDDLFANGQGGTWHVANGTTDFGGGDDAIENGAGGTIHLAYGGIFLGASGAYGNSFQNDGTILTSDFGVIDMGTGPASPLVNDGVISFVDGAPDDMLVILGDLGGDGAINVDLSVLNGTSDLLYVDGNVVDGTTQAINVSIDGIPTETSSEMAPVVAVTGNVAANAFTGGQVLNYDPRNFLTYDVSVGTAQADGVTTVLASVEVTGLNDTGVLAASVAQGAQSLVNSTIGTLRQRTGVLYPLEDGQAGISPWVRYFTDKGNLDPAASGFGSGADFGFEQENSGTEFGMDFAVGNGFHLGVLGGNADGKQRLTGGEGSDRLKLHGAGVYASWYGPRFYVDLSQRWMDFDARLDSASGELETSGNATATNIEAGLTGWSAYGVDIVPQAQYTRTTIDNVGPLAGSLTQMDVDGGTSERGRVGVAVSRTFAGTGGFQWTPYGALSAVREFDGETGFTVADAFTGSTSSDGTSTLAELGIGLHKGGFSATAGFNWSDGGAVDSARGGQLVVRYTW